MRRYSLIVVGFALAAVTVAAQTTGLPNYGVGLSGSAAAPVLINNSGHRILAYTLMFDGGGQRPHPTSIIMVGALRNRPMSQVGIAPGATHSFQAATANRPQTADAGGQAPVYSTVSVDAVLFEDGSVVGPDNGDLLESVAGDIQAETDVHKVLRDEPGSPGWQEVQAIESGQKNLEPPAAFTPLGQVRYTTAARRYAQELLRLRTVQGEAAALKLAQSTPPYPAIHKGGN